jgi:anti-anti-sigma factor
VQFASRRYGNIIVAAPSGRIDHTAAGPFEQALAPLLGNAEAAAIVLDFGGVDYISSVGLRVLMIAAKQMRARKARIAVTTLQPVVAEIFKISRFDAVVEVFPSLRGALGALSPEARDVYDAG